MTVSTKTEQALRDAMERLLSGQSQHTDGKLTKNNLCREAEVSRATMNRATEILTEWDARTATSPAGILQHRYTAELAELRGELRRSRKKCHALQEQVETRPSLQRRPFTGRPTCTDGKLAKNNLWREADVSRGTMNRPTDVLAD
ncbi:MULTISPECIES: hypothetical protein [unclassified Streptomyces]|uniref:hypothetical protein n=1 Tax=unclassified Streptomyces TaxID=2593676 RepID=UPI002E2674D3|nr:hypothetical protein OG296_39100 [Streptomyces sp. NBC_01001]